MEIVWEMLYLRETDERQSRDQMCHMMKIRGQKDQNQRSPRRLATELTRGRGDKERKSSVSREQEDQTGLNQAGSDQNGSDQTGLDQIRPVQTRPDQTRPV